MLLFHLGDNRYAFPVSEVVEVTPSVRLDVIPRTPAYIAGLFNCRGTQVPVLDLCRLLLDRACADTYTSRIVLVQFPTGRGESRLLGLLAERVTDTLDIDPAQFTASGISCDEAPCLGDVAQTAYGLVQRVNTDGLLSPQVEARLFPAEVS